MRTLAPAVALTLLLAGCGAPPTAGGDAGASRPARGDAGDDAVTADQVPGSVPAGKALRVEPHPEALDPHPVDVVRTTTVAGGRALDLYYWGGPEPCYLLQRVAVAYPAKKVVIGVFEGTSPDARGPCTELAVLKVVRVTLRDSIGDRRVVDGLRYAGSP